MHLDALRVTIALMRRSALRTAARSSRSGTSQPIRTSPGARQQHERHAAGAEALLVPRGRDDDLIDSRRLAPSSVTGSPRARSSSRTCARSSSCAGQAQRGEQPEPDGLAVAVAGVAGGGLDRVADGVAEVQRPGGARRRARPRRRPRASCARSRGSCARPPRSRRPARRAPTASPPAIRAVFSTSTQPAASSAAGSVASVSGSTSTRGGLVVGADVVLRLGQVDAGLAAVGGVDLGDERGGHLHDRHAALVGGGAEAGEVADDAAAERDHVVGAGHPRGERARATRARRSRASCAPRPARSRSSPPGRGASPSRSAYRAPRRSRR